MVGVLDGVRDCGHQHQPFAQPRPLRPHVLVEPPAANELHREVRLRPVAGLLDPGLVDLGDARVVEAAEELVLELEPPQYVGRHHARADDLQRDAPLRPLLFRLVDDAHRAFADRREDPERADARRRSAARRRAERRRRVGIRHSIRRRALVP